MGDVIQFSAGVTASLDELRKEFLRLGFDRLAGSSQVLLLVTIDQPHEKLEIPVEELIGAMRRVPPGKHSHVSDLMDAVMHEVEVLEEVVDEDPPSDPEPQGEES